MARHIRFLAWALSACVTIALVTLPVSVEAQLALSTTVIAAMFVVWCYGRDGWARWAFLALGSLVVCRYIVWRLTSTLPPLDQPVNFALGLLLIAAELYCVLILVISLIINADPLERPGLERQDDAELPLVDVFIPTYNEDEYILATTIAAAKSLDYPAAKLVVWLLDDGGTDQKCGDRNPVKAEAAQARRAALQKLCQEMGARYLTRAKNEHAKAGNLNNGLKHATGSIVAVFDADHAPFRSFLRETVGHFALDPKLFLVQTPHVFLNPDPIERNLRTFQRMPSENEMFYSVTQRGLDKWNGSFFCGSAALLRREALDTVGGFSGITITEDCETAFELHSKGWTSVFVDKPLIAGLQPETLESFIGQRSRWCQGMFQLLLLKNPIFSRGLHPIQKLAYLSSMIFWLFPLPRLVFTMAPLLHIFFDVKIFVSTMDEAVAYTTTYIIVNLMLQNYLYGRFRWPFMSELYEYVQGVYLFKAIIAVALSPRSPTFNVTAKGISLDQDHLSGLSAPFFAIFGLLAAGAATAFYRYAFEPGAELMLIVGLWTSFNLIIAGAALGVVAERREPDRFPRLAINRRGTLAIDAKTYDVDVGSVSAGGCSLKLTTGRLVAAGATIGATGQLTVTPLDGGRACVPLQLELVRSETSGTVAELGFSFTGMTPATYFTLADLMYGDPGAMTRFLAKRRVHRNLLRGAGRFALWGAMEPFRAISYALRRSPHAAPPMTAALPAQSPVHLNTISVAPAVMEPNLLEARDDAAILAGLKSQMAETAASLFDMAESATASRVKASAGQPAATAVTQTGQMRRDEFSPADWLRAMADLAAREVPAATKGDWADVAPSIAA